MSVKIIAPRPPESDKRLVRDEVDTLTVRGLESRGFNLSDGLDIQSMTTDKLIRLVGDIARDIMDGL